MKLMTKEIEKAFAKQGDTSQMEADDVKIICKFFTPDANATWYVFDRNPDDNDVLWVFADLGDPQMAEIGTVRLSELEKIRGSLGLPVERDRHYPIMEYSLNDVLTEVKGVYYGKDDAYNVTKIEGHEN